MGATVNAIRKQPSRTSSAEVLVGAGTDDTLRLGLGVTGALGAYASYRIDRKSTRLNSSHLVISYAVFCLKKKKTATVRTTSGFNAPIRRRPALHQHRASR